MNKQAPKVNFPHTRSEIDISERTGLDSRVAVGPVNVFTGDAAIVLRDVLRTRALAGKSLYCEIRDGRLRVEFASFVSEPRKYRAVNRRTKRF